MRFRPISYDLICGIYSWCQPMSMLSLAKILMSAECCLAEGLTVTDVIHALDRQYRDLNRPGA